MQCFVSGINWNFKFRQTSRFKQLKRNRNWIEKKRHAKASKQVVFPLPLQRATQHCHPVSSSQSNYVPKMFQDARDRCEYQLHRAFLPSTMGKESCITQNTIYSSAHSAKYSESSERDLQYWLQLLGHIPPRCQTSSLLGLRQWQHASRHEIKCLMLSQYFE